MDTTVYMYADAHSGEPRLRVGGNLRPTEAAMQKILQHARSVFDSDAARESLQEKADSLPQDRSPEDFTGSFVLLGLARFDKNTGAVSYEARDYEFNWGEMGLAGRDPSRCDKGYFEALDTYYTPSDSKPAGW
jgi:hypothetical protein